MAWASLLGIYNRMNSTQQDWIVDLLQGYSSYPNPAWKNLRGSSGLYDSTAKQFRWESNVGVSNDATAYGASLLFMMGMIPQTGSLAIPLEEFGYEYKLNILDPELFHLNLATRTVTVSIFMSGTIKFVYGTSPVSQLFMQSGVFEVVFASDWNSITTVTRLSDLPTNRKYLGEIPISLIFKIAVYSSPMGVSLSVNGTQYVTPYEQMFANSTLLYLEFPASYQNWTWNYWSDGTASRTRSVTLTSDLTLIGYYAGGAASVTPAPVLIIPPLTPTETGEVNFMALPEMLAVVMGLPVVAAQLLLGIIFLVAVLLPLAIASRGRLDTIVYVMLGLAVMSFLTAIGWFPIFATLLVILVVAALWSGKVREWLT
jgi:hypothetical protein